MAQLDKEAYETKYNNGSTGLFRSATVAPISRLRTMITDQKDSILWKSNDLARIWLLCGAEDAGPGGTDYYLTTFPYAITDYAQHAVFVAQFDVTNGEGCSLRYDDGVNMLYPVALKKITSSGRIFLEPRDILEGGCYLIAYKAPSLADPDECFIVLNPEGATKRRVIKTLTTSQILNGNSTPIQLLAAQGAGTFIKVSTPITCKFKFGSAAFATLPQFKFYYGSAGQSFTNSGSSSSILDQPESFIKEIIPVVAEGNLATLENVGIYWQVDTTNPTGGTGSTLVIEFEYEVLSL